MVTRRWLLALIALIGGFGWAEWAQACERGGSAINARRALPTYSLPRIGVGMSLYLPPRYPPPPFYPPGYFTNYYQNQALQYGNQALQYGNQPMQYQDYGQTSPAANYSLPSAALEPPPAKPVRLLAPSLPQQPQAVSLPAGTVRMRYLYLTVSGMAGATDAGRIEEELGKLAGVRGVNVKQGNLGPATIKVWYSDKEPVGMAAVLAEIARLGFQATPVEG